MDPNQRNSSRRHDGFLDCYTNDTRIYLLTRLQLTEVSKAFLLVMGILVLGPQPPRRLYQT
jgi:hypothetical protein